MLRSFLGAARRFAFAIGLIAASASGAALAQAPSAPQASAELVAQAGGTIQEIRIEGTQRVEPDTVRSYLQVQPGEPYDAQKLDASLKALFATGLFSDVTIRRDGDALVVHVVENPVINRIAFEGNSKLTDESLTDEIQLRPRLVYTREKVQSDVARILELYRRSGRFAATVQPKVIELPQNRVNLVFEIDEGPATGIRSITFLGNHVFSELTLRDVISTTELRWYRFLSNSDNYDPDRLTYDRELLRKFYLTQGYPDFRVVSAVAELTPDREGFMLTFTLEEGARYHFGKIAITSELKDVDPAFLRGLLTVHEGSWYNADELDTSISAITDALGDRGYAFVVVTPTVKRNADTKTIDVSFDVKEGPRVYVERIDITGNLRTQDKVIRREFRLVEGDAFNSTKLQRSEQRIKNLNFFKTVDVTNTPGSAPDKTIIHVDVQEESTGDFSVGVGYSTTDGPLANIGVHERNLLGQGLDLRLDTTVAYRDQQAELSFTQPYFLDRNLAAGFDIFALQRDNSYYDGYTETSYGNSFRLGYQFTECASPDAYLYFARRRDQRRAIKARRSTFFRRPDRGSRRSPASRCSTTSATAPSSQPRVTTCSKRPMSPASAARPIFCATASAAAITIRSRPAGWRARRAKSAISSDSANTVRIEDRYFIGGDNLRGFASGGIGPRDTLADEALGANKYWLGSAQLAMPLGLPKEFGLSGHVFTDFGSAWSARRQRSEHRSKALLPWFRSAMASRGIRRSARCGSIWPCRS